MGTGGGRVRSSGGWMLPEWIVGSLLASILLGGALVALLGMSRIVGAMIGAEERIESVRTVWTVLHQEVGVGRPGVDWGLEPRSDRALWLRAFRALAVPCAWEEGALEGWVIWQGARAPDPVRDSILALDREGAWTAIRFRPGGGTSSPPSEQAGVDPCPPVFGGVGAVVRWEVDPLPAPPVLFRVFERGRYSLEDAAFRYRRGAEGRQPLTPERLGPASRFWSALDGGLEVEVEGIGGGESLRWRVSPLGLPPP